MESMGWVFKAALKKLQLYLKIASFIKYALIELFRKTVLLPYFSRNSHFIVK